MNPVRNATGPANRPLLLVRAMTAEAHTGPDEQAVKARPALNRASGAGAERRYQWSFDRVLEAVRIGGRERQGVGDLVRGAQVDTVLDNGGRLNVDRRLGVVDGVLVVRVAQAQGQTRGQLAVGAQGQGENALPAESANGALGVKARLAKP